MRFFATYSSARRDWRLSTMGLARVDTPSWVVGGQLLDRPGWGAAVQSCITGCTFSKNSQRIPLGVIENST